MLKWMTKQITKRVALVRVYGPLTDRRYSELSSIEDLESYLSAAEAFTIKHIAVTINSTGGPQHVADYFVHRLRTWSEETE